jgi:hypothetical protein
MVYLDIINYVIGGKLVKKFIKELLIRIHPKIFA